MGNDALVVKEKIKALQPKFEEVGMDMQTFKKEASFAYQACLSNPKLMECPVVSIVAAVYNVALTGTTLNPALAYAYLVPRGKKCCLDISYRGLVYLATSNGKIKRLHANVVWDCDRFKLIEGTNPGIFHEPDPYRPKAAARVGAYAVATFPDGSTQHCWMTIDDIQVVQKKSMMSSGGPWKDFRDEMWKKTVIKRLCKLLGRDDKFAKAIEVINEHEGIDFTQRQLKPDVDMPQSLPEPEDIIDQPPEDAKEGESKEFLADALLWEEKLGPVVLKTKILKNPIFKKKTDLLSFNQEQLESFINLCTEYQKKGNG